jgi:hypothetical protein
LPESFPFLSGIFHILHQYDIPLFRPQGREESQVSTQLSASMRSREIADIARQSDIMLRIENV